MQEVLRGIVLKKLAENKYLVKVFKEGSSCSSCGFSKVCSLGGMKEGDDVIEAKGKDLNPGDEVVILEDSKGIILAAFLIFLSPIFAFVVGYYVSRLFKIAEFLSALIGFLLMGIYFTILRIFDKKLRDSLFNFELKRKS